MTDESVPAEKKKEPEWLSKLAVLGASATARQAKDAKLRGSHGAASAGRSVKLWECRCGWSGDAKQLKPDAATFIPACPSCGKSDGLKATA